MWWSGVLAHFELAVATARRRRLWIVYGTAGALILPHSCIYGFPSGLTASSVPIRAPLRQAFCCSVLRSLCLRVFVWLVLAHIYGAWGVVNGCECGASAVRGLWSGALTALDNLMPFSIVVCATHVRDVCRICICRFYLLHFIHVYIPITTTSI